MSLVIVRGGMSSTNMRPISPYYFTVRDEESGSDIGHITGDNIELELNSYGFSIHQDPQAKPIIGNDETFQDIQLLTADNRYVSTVQIPKMNPLPKVLSWGVRFFIDSDYMIDEVPVYHECFGMVATITKEKT